MSEKRYSIGIDMGGTNTVFGVVGDDGEIVARGHVPTSGSDAGTYASSLAASVGAVLSGAGISAGAVRGVGMCAPCADWRTGVIEAATDLPWPSPIPMGALLSARLGMTVRLSNDANAAAMGEMLYGAARGMTDFIELTLGTGVGAGVVSGGRLLTGHRGFAGELGHMRVPGYTPRTCACGRRGCLQTYASAGGIVRTAAIQRRAHNLPHDDTLTARDVGHAADRGEAWALETMRFTGSVLGDACADFAAFSDPGAIILFGGVAESFRHMAPAMEEALRDNALSLYHGIRILRSELPHGDAAVLGAAACAGA